MSNVKELQPDEVEVLLRKLFIMYASYGTRSNLQYLRSAKFQKLISDAGVLDPKLNKKQVDLIFYAVNKRDPNMTFERFLECLVKVSEIKFAGQTKDQALKRLLNEFILPLYSTSDQGDLDPDKSLFVDADAMDLLSSIFPILNDLYVNYFAWELTSSETHEVISERSQKAFHLFLRDFDICPTIISKSSAFALWCDLVVMERINPKIEAIIEPDYERGQCFTLTKFVMSIYLAAILGYQHDTSMADRPNIEKLLLILERMELSKGFMQIEKKTSRPHQAKTSLLPSKNVINRALNTPSSELSKADASVHSINETRINPTDITHLTSFQEEEGDDIAALELEENGLEALEKYLEQLQKIFTAYCSYGEPMNRTRLKSAKLMKMLKDCGLFRTAPGSANTSRASIRSTQSRLVSKVDVDLIFAKLTGNNQARQQLRRQSSFASRSHLSLANSNAVGRMEFQQFLKALEYIAEKVAPDWSLEEGYIYLIENFILKLEQTTTEDSNMNVSFIDNLMNTLQDPDVVEILNHVHKSIIYYYHFYADQYGYMNLDNFIRFARDFSIFPDIVSKPKLSRFFYALAGIYAQTEVPKSTSGSYMEDSRAPEQTENELIDEHLFIESLVLISNELAFATSDSSPTQKIWYLMERMSQSDGPLKVRQAQGSNRTGEYDLLSIIRRRYPQNFSVPYVAKSSFGELLRYS